MGVDINEIKALLEKLCPNKPIDRAVTSAEFNMAAYLIMSNRIADAIERYVDEKIESDKVLLGILRDIQKTIDRNQPDEGSGIVAISVLPSV